MACKRFLLLSVAIVLLHLNGIGAESKIIDAPLGYRSDQILVQPKQGADPAALTRFHTQRGSQVLATMKAADGLLVISVPADNTAAKLVEKYRGSGLVEFAEPDYIRYTTLTAPNDPKYLDGTLWGLNNYGQNSGTARADIDAPEAWDVLNSASNIVVAVLDTGIRYTHEDLAGNMWVNPVDGTHGTNSIGGTQNPSDDEGHGTLMSGVIGAVGNNSKGMVGVAWNVQLMACKSFDSAGASTDSALVAAIDYARVNGARIINASFDSTNFGLALSNAIYRAAQSGIIFVSSCGNNVANVDVSPHFPACFAIDNVLSVAYTTRSDSLGRFSNYGATNVDLAAPGAGIYSCFFTSDAAYLGSEFLEGTSYAAAYVSGALALILAKYPAEPYQQTLARLLNSTDPIPALAGKCKTGGRLNLRHALAPSIRLTNLPSPIPGLLQFRALTSPLQRCLVQSSTDLINWSPMSTNIASLSGTFDFADLLLTSPAPRFYRAVQSP